MAKEKTPKQTLPCAYCLAGRVVLLDKAFDCPNCFGKGSITEGEHSPLTDALIEISVLKSQVALYRTFAEMVSKWVKPLDDLGDLKLEAKEMPLVYVSNLVYRAMNKLNKENENVA